MALRINDAEYYAIDAHSHLGRCKTPLGHGVASFLGDDLIKDLDEVGLDCAVASLLGASYTDYSEANQIIAEEMAKHPKRIIAFCRINPNFSPEATAKSLEHCLGAEVKGYQAAPGRLLVGTPYQILQSRLSQNTTYTVTAPIGKAWPFVLFTILTSNVPAEGSR